MTTRVTEFEQELLKKIVETCQIDEDLTGKVTREDDLIGPDSPLGLDSLDAVELVVMIQSEYGIRISGKETGMRILTSLATLSQYIQENATSPAQG